VAVMVWWYVALVATVRTGRGLAAACGLLALACAFHLQMLMLTPALGVALAARARRDGGWKPALQWFALAFVLSVTGVVVAASLWPTPYPVHFGGADVRMLVPLTAPPDDPGMETLLQARHWTAVANLLFLFAPTAFPAALWLAGTRGRRVARDPMPLAFGLGAGAWLLFVAIWHADLGPWSDWDLFAGAGFPLTLLAGLLAVRGLGRHYAAGVLLVLALGQMARTVPFVAANHLSVAPPNAPPYQGKPAAPGSIPMPVPRFGEVEPGKSR
ncbi:MAG: hypothetical protein QHJ73_08410, partial [Armatimonadota bacterium]|nr:hypothetical protein [Armatimonadota bacterium]